VCALAAYVNNNYYFKKQSL